jgi:hypothetical protein
MLARYLLDKAYPDIAIQISRGSYDTLDKQSNLIKEKIY